MLISEAPEGKVDARNPVSETKVCGLCYLMTSRATFQAHFALLAAFDLIVGTKVWVPGQYCAETTGPGSNVSSVQCRIRKLSLLGLGVDKG